ncbi:MAG: hypothetical protein V8R80_02550 [Eubacterium sp.]
MGDINHDCTCHGNPLVPQVVKIIKITEETPDVKTFRIQTVDGKKPFATLPGQLGMISVQWELGKECFPLLQRERTGSNLPLKKWAC